MISALRRGIWVIAAVAALLCLAVTAYVVADRSAGLTSTAQLVVTGSASDSQDNAFTASQYVNQRMSTYATVATSDSVIEPAATALGVAPSALAGQVTATVPLDTTVIALGVLGETPQQAQQRGAAVQMALSEEIIALETSADGAPRVRVQVLNSAGLPAPSALPSPVVAALLGLLAGLALGVATVLAFHVLRTRRPLDGVLGVQGGSAEPATAAVARTAVPVEPDPAHVPRASDPTRAPEPTVPAPGPPERGSTAPGTGTPAAAPPQTPAPVSESPPPAPKAGSAAPSTRVPASVSAPGGTQPRRPESTSGPATRPPASKPGGRASEPANGVASPAPVQDTSAPAAPDHSPRGAEPRKGERPEDVPHEDQASPKPAAVTRPAQAPTTTRRPRQPWVRPYLGKRPR